MHCKISITKSTAKHQRNQRHKRLKKNVSSKNQRLASHSENIQILFEKHAANHVVKALTGLIGENQIKK